MEHKGWNRRGYLPHCDFAGNLQAITFRLRDSLPIHVLEKWRQEFERDRASEDLDVRRRAEAGLHRRLAALEDAGHGSCLLSVPAHAESVQRILTEGHGLAYRLIEWCIMPNHVHVLIKGRESHPLATVVKRWKGVSGLQINRLAGRQGRLWMRNYHDRLIRDEDHFFHARAYIRKNPVKARLCARPENWPYSRCGVGWNPEEEGSRALSMDAHFFGLFSQRSGMNSAVQFKASRYARTPQSSSGKKQRPSPFAGDGLC